MKYETNCLLLQVRKLSQTGIILLLEKEVVTPSQIQEFIHPVILQLTQHPASDDHRTEAASVSPKFLSINFRHIKSVHSCIGPSQARQVVRTMEQGSWRVHCSVD